MFKKMGLMPSNKLQSNLHEFPVVYPYERALDFFPGFCFDALLIANTLFKVTKCINVTLF